MSPEDESKAKAKALREQRMRSIKVLCALNGVRFKDVAERVGRKPASLNTTIVTGNLRVADLEGIARALGYGLKIELYKDNGEVFSYLDKPYQSETEDSTD